MKKCSGSIPYGGYRGGYHTGGGGGRIKSDGGMDAVGGSGIRFAFIDGFSFGGFASGEGLKFSMDSSYFEVMFLENADSLLVSSSGFSGCPVGFSSESLLSFGDSEYKRCCDQDRFLGRRAGSDMA